MSDLIARLEAATEPSRELDLEIINVGAEHKWRWNDREPDTITCDRHGPGAVGNPVCMLERFTSSLDDALSLVPEGFEPHVLAFSHGDNRTFAFQIFPPTGHAAWEHGTIIAAALKACAASGTDGDTA